MFQSSKIEKGIAKFVATISIIVTMVSVEQTVNAVTTTTATTTSNANTINCQSKKGTTSTTTALGTLKFAGGKCTGENGGTVAAGGVKSNSGTIGNVNRACFKTDTNTYSCLGQIFIKWVIFKTNE